jgi:hypothetical protein
MKHLIKPLTSLLSAALIFAFAQQTFAAEAGKAPQPRQADELAFGVHEDSTEMKKIELEEWLVWRASKDLSQFVPLEHFKVYANVEFKNERNSVRRVSNVNLTMFGTIASFVTSDRPVPHQGLFGKVHKLEMTLVVSDDVSPKTVEAMHKVMLAKVPIISKDRVVSNVIHMDRPAWGFANFMREYKMPIAALFLLGIFMFGMFHIIKNVKIQTSLRVGPYEHVVAAPAAHAQKPKALSPLTPVEMMTTGEETPVPDAPVVEESTYTEPGKELLGSLFAKTLESLELRKLRSHVLTLSLDECVTYVKSDTRWAGLMVSLMTPARAEKVMARLTPEERKKVIAQTFDIDPAVAVKKADEIVKSFDLYRGKKSQDVSTNDRLAVYLDQIGPYEEERVFQELLSRREYERFANVVRHAVPTELLTKVPFAAVQNAVLRLTHDDRVELIAFSPNDVVEQVWKALAKTDDAAKALIQEEVKKCQGKMRGGDQVPSRALGRLMKEVRDSLRQNYQYAEAVKPHNENFIWTRTKGLQGAEHKHHQVAKKHVA